MTTFWKIPLPHPGDPYLSPLLHDRVAAGLCASAINEAGDGDCLWGIDDTEELRFAEQARAKLRERAMR